MTNRQEGLELINQAVHIFERDVANAFEDNDYNLVVRRSQEAVELSLKGALKILGIDYPKIHHVGGIFRKRVKEKSLEIEDDICQRIEEVSLWLAETREPSFYFEKKFTKEDAVKAQEDAGFVIEEIKNKFNG